MAHLGLPLMHRLPGQGWREAKLPLPCFHCNAHIQTLENGKKMHSLYSTLLLWGVCTSSGLWKWVSFQGSSVSKYWSTPVLKASQFLFCRSRSDITNTPQRPPQYLQLLFSFHGLHSMAHIDFMKTSPICQHPPFAFSSFSSSCIRRQPKTRSRSGFTTSKYNF